MSQELERVDTINLGKVLLSPDNQRSKRAINMIREYARHHMKTEDVRIDEDLAHIVWKRGIKHPPRKVRVRMTKTEEGYVLIAPYEEELETKVTPEEKPTKLEEKAKEKVKPKEEAKEVAAEVEAEVKEVTEKPKKAPKKVTAKEKPKAPAKEEKPTKLEEKAKEEVKPKEKPKTVAAEIVEEAKATTKKPKKAPSKAKPKIAGFVDLEKGAQHYIDRYNKEKKYQAWFHKNYPKYSSIYEAVGLEEPKEKPKAPAKEEKPKKAPAKEKPKKKSS